MVRMPRHAIPRIVAANHPSKCVANRLSNIPSSPAQPSTNQRAEENPPRIADCCLSVLGILLIGLGLGCPRVRARERLPRGEGGLVNCLDHGRGDLAAEPT